MVRAGVRVHILSGSPEQMRRRLEDKLRLDGISWDSFTLKPNLQNLLRLRFRAVRDQLGYKLPALLASRAELGETRRGRRARATETLFGDDAEADAYVYSLYADFLAGPRRRGRAPARARARARLRGRRRTRRWRRRARSSTGTSSSASSSTSSSRRRPTTSARTARASSPSTTTSRRRSSCTRTGASARTASCASPWSS